MGLMNGAEKVHRILIQDLTVSALEQGVARLGVGEGAGPHKSTAVAKAKTVAASRCHGGREGLEIWTTVVDMLRRRDNGRSWSDTFSALDEMPTGQGS